MVQLFFFCILSTWAVYCFSEMLVLPLFSLFCEAVFNGLLICMPFLLFLPQYYLSFFSSPDPIRQLVYLCIQVRVLVNLRVICVTSTYNFHPDFVFHITYKCNSVCRASCLMSIFFYIQTSPLFQILNSIFYILNLIHIPNKMPYNGSQHILVFFKCIQVLLWNWRSDTMEYGLVPIVTITGT